MVIFPSIIMILIPLLWNFNARFLIRPLTKYLLNNEKSLLYLCSLLNIKPLNFKFHLQLLLGHILSIYIILASAFRNHLFYDILISNNEKDYNEIIPLFTSHFMFFIGLSCIILGQIFSCSAFYALGIRGTCLNDHINIVLPKIINCFPFNVVNHPMYIGFNMFVCGLAIINGRTIGLILALCCIIGYVIASKIEHNFTENIYRQLTQAKPVNNNAMYPIDDINQTMKDKMNGSHNHAYSNNNNKTIEGYNYTYKKSSKEPVPFIVLPAITSNSRYTLRVFLIVIGICSEFLIIQHVPLAVFNNLSFYQLLF